MKKVFPVAILMGVIIVLASCMESLSQRFDSFVSSVEEDCSFKPYSEEYWMEKDIKFNKLHDEFESKRSSFKSDEKREINSAMARYEYQRLNSLVSYVEENFSEFSEDDWLGANERFRELAREYKENRHAYNSSEKGKIDSLIGHYGGMVIRSKIPGVKESIKSILREIGVSF